MLFQGVQCAASKRGSTVQESWLACFMHHGHASCLGWHASGTVAMHHALVCMLFAPWPCIMPWLACFSHHGHASSLGWHASCTEATLICPFHNSWKSGANTAAMLNNQQSQP
eukprot:1161911-Pelagomonas_calceolata.AAC.6